MNKTDRIKNKLRQDDRKQRETKTYEAILFYFIF